MGVLKQDYDFRFHFPLVHRGSAKLGVPKGPQTTFSGKKNMTGRKHDEGVPESVWKRYKSKDLNFLHRSCTPIFFSTKNKVQPKSKTQKQKNTFFGFCEKNILIFFQLKSHLKSIFQKSILNDFSIENTIKIFFLLFFLF